MTSYQRCGRANLLAIICFVAIGHLSINHLDLVSFFIGTSASKSKATGEAVGSMAKKLGDGCYHVFLDVGANLGVHGHFLFELEKYPEATLAEEIYR